MTRALRLFIAAKLPAAARAEIAARSDQLRASGLEGWRWAAPGAVHLTLRFLGDTQPERVAAVAAALQRTAAATAPLRLSLAAAGTFGGRRPRVLWLGLAGDLERLQAAAELLNRELAAEGWAPPQRPLRPHITLARARRSANAAQTLAARRLAAAAAPAPYAFDVSAVQLIHSTLTPDGAQHAGLASARLGADAAL